MKKILLFSAAILLGVMACTEQPEEITDTAYARLFSPTDLEAEVQNIINVTLTWQKVENAESYSVELYKTAAPEVIVRNADIEETRCTFENLDEDVEYGARVQANSAKIPASNWITVTFTTTPPPPPETIEWNFSDDEFANITEGDFKETETVRGLDVVGGTGGVRRTTNAVTIDEYSFTYRLDLRGSGTWDSDLGKCNRVIHFKADKPCIVTVYANSATAGRTLKITDKNNTVLGEYVTTGTPGKVIVNVTVASDIYIYSAGSGIEVYLVKMVIGGSYEPDHTATLRTLAVTGETLTPAFAAGTTDYEVSVAKSVTEVTISATKNHPNQTIEGDGKQILTGDTEVFPVRVTAEDGVTQTTYNITVNRAATASSDATLKSLAVSPGTLDPAFEPDITSYTATVSYGTESVTITAAANHKFAKVGNNGTVVAENLTVGDNGPYNVVVLAEDLSVKTYSVTVVREPDSGPGDDTPGTIVNGFYVVPDGEEFQTTSANIAATEWVSYNKTNFSDRTKCYTGNVPNLSASDRIVTFKIKGAASFTVQADGNGSRNLTYTINGGNPITSKTYINGCDTEDVNTGTTGECTIEIAGSNGSVYLHGITFHQ